MKYGLEYAGPRRSRREWRGTLLAVLVLLGLSALCGWLWSVVARFTFEVSGVRTAGVPEWVAFGIVGTLGLCAMAAWAWSQMLPPAGTEDDLMLECMPEMEAEDAARIVEACRVECRTALRLVQGAQRTLSVEDYGDALEGAQCHLDRVTRTLGELRRTLEGDGEFDVSSFKFQREGGAR
ncbi:MAG: hypothetical protein KCHDKBKB_03028 [Elusimicrobia bacterium]|nr:hypothetical protein [Elusimicrobiota bacterium]